LKRNAKNNKKGFRRCLLGNNIATAQARVLVVMGPRDKDAIEERRIGSALVLGMRLSLRWKEV
jgi:hypothetical protein